MRVKELIKAPQKLPQSYEVLVDGYEGGLSQACPPVVTKVELNVNIESYYGPHEELHPSYTEQQFADCETANVVVLRR